MDAYLNWLDGMLNDGRVHTAGDPAVELGRASLDNAAAARAAGESTEALLYAVIAGQAHLAALCEQLTERVEARIDRLESDEP